MHSELAFAVEQFGCFKKEGDNMANAYRKHVLYTNGKEYGEGDPIILRLKTGVILVGIIKKICFHIGPVASVVLYVDNSEITIDVDKIDN